VPLNHTLHHHLYENADLGLVMVQVSTWFVNAGGNELPTGQMPLPTVFIALAVASAVLLIAWSIFWVQKREVRFLALIKFSSD
jgi:hypothetical protein